MLAVNISDPYLLQKSDFDTLTEDWPEVTYADIYNFLLTSQSTYTEVKAYKSLDAYQFVVTGQTFDVNCKRIQPSLYLFLGKVRHSQSILTKRHNQAWVIVDKDGAVENGHCTFMAGQ